MKFKITEDAAIWGEPKDGCMCVLARTIIEVGALPEDREVWVAPDYIVDWDTDNLDKTYFVAVDEGLNYEIQPYEEAKCLLDSFDRLLAEGSLEERLEFFNRWKDQEFEVVPR